MDINGILFGHFLSFFLCSIQFIFLLVFSLFIDHFWFVSLVSTHASHRLQSCAIDFAFSHVNSRGRG